MGKWGRVFGASALACVFASGGALAEVGKASAGPGEWFLGFNAGGGAAWGTEHEAYIAGDNSNKRSVNFDEGIFYSGGVEIGYRFAEPDSLVDRMELNVDLGMLSRDISRDTTGAFFALKDGNGDRDGFGFFGFSNPELRAEGEEETASIETRLSFKGLLLEGEDHTVLASFEPFFRYEDADSHLEVTRGDAANRRMGLRRDSIEAEYYGLQLALEMEKPLSESLSLVGRASAGAYYVTSDIGSSLRYLAQPDGFSLSDSGNSWGGRFGGALGIKVPFYHTGASLTLLGTIDYMSDVATIDHIPYPAMPSSKPTKAGFDDQLELGGKVGLVFPLH